MRLIAKILFTVFIIIPAAYVKIMREEIDEPGEAARYASKPETLVQPQRNTLLSLLRAFLTRGSTGRQFHE
jgi:hypothetical protein